MKIYIWDIIENQLKDDIIKEVDYYSNENRQASYFMPYHEIVRELKETTKLRISYDCASKVKGEVCWMIVWEQPKFVSQFAQNYIEIYRSYNYILRWYGKSIFENKYLSARRPMAWLHISG